MICGSWVAIAWLLLTTNDTTIAIFSNNVLVHSEEIQSLIFPLELFFLRPIIKFNRLQFYLRRTNFEWACILSIVYGQFHSVWTMSYCFHAMHWIREKIVRFANKNSICKISHLTIVLLHWNNFILSDTFIRNLSVRVRERNSVKYSNCTEFHSGRWIKSIYSKLCDWLWHGQKFQIDML